MLILVDTSVWIDHLRDGEPQLEQLLIQGQVAIHPFVIGEIACGNLGNRQTILSYLNNLQTQQLRASDHIIKINKIQ